MSAQEYYHTQPSSGEDRPETLRYAYNPQQGPHAYNPEQGPHAYNPEQAYPAHPEPAAAGYSEYNPDPRYHHPTEPPYAEHEEDRGVGGALAGGALGAYGGHQINHGLIGTVGGAYAGSKLQNHFRDEEERKEHERRRAEEERARLLARPPPPPPSSGPVMAGNFSASSNDITVDGDYNLVASCRGIDGQHKMSSISLNSVLTNSNGELRWAKDGNFGATAREVRLLDEGRVLGAELGDGRGGWNRSTIRLDERITNRNGELTFLE